MRKGREKKISIASWKNRPLTTHSFSLAHFLTHSAAACSVTRSHSFSSFFPFLMFYYHFIETSFFSLLIFDYLDFGGIMQKKYFQNQRKTNLSQSFEAFALKFNILKKSVHGNCCIIPKRLWKQSIFIAKWTKHFRPMIEMSINYIIYFTNKFHENYALNRKIYVNDNKKPDNNF